MRGRHSRRNPAPPLTTGRLTPMIAGQPDPAMHKKLQGIAEGLRAHYGDPASEARKASAVPPQPAGEAASVQAHDAAATPGTSPAPPVAGEDVPGTPGPPSSLPLGRQEGSEGGVQKWVVELPAGLRLLSLNDRIHWSVKGRITRDLRKAAFVMARNARVPHLERARVVVEYQPPQVTRRRDLDNVGPASGKPCIDGLVDAKVLADDSPRYLAEVAYRIGEPFPRGRLVLHVEAVGQ